MEFSLSTDAVLIIVACAAAILFGGIVKGTLGVGLPLFAVPIMSLMIGSTQAIALVAVPVLVSNIWQAWQEASWKASLKRFWPLMLTQAIMTMIAVHWTLSFSVKQLNMLVAFAVILAVVSISAKLEAEMSEMSDEDRQMFLEELGQTEPGLNRLIRSAYSLLGLQTYFTAGVKEVRAWTIHVGDTGPQAAGVIHTDFEKGYIRAQTISYEDFISYKGEQGAKDAGKMRAEGKEYVVKDGDVMNFLFSS